MTCLAEHTCSAPTHTLSPLWTDPPVWNSKFFFLFLALVKSEYNLNIIFQTFLNKKWNDSNLENCNKKRLYMNNRFIIVMTGYCLYWHEKKIIIKVHKIFMTTYKKYVVLISKALSHIETYIHIINYIYWGILMEKYI